MSHGFKRRNGCPCLCMKTGCLTHLSCLFYSSEGENSIKYFCSVVYMCGFTSVLVFGAVESLHLKRVREEGGRGL